MFVQYKPKDGEAQQWDFDPDEVRQSQAEMVEKRYGANWDAFLAAVRGGEAKARRVLLWHLIRLTHHTLRIEDVPDFRMGELTVEYSSTELRQLKDQLDRIDPNALPEDQAAELDLTRARVMQELTDALLRERGDDGATVHIPAGADLLDDPASEPVGKANSDG